MKSVSVVGAGLVGSLLALNLARKGVAVDLYEKRSDLRKKKNLLVGEGRSINLAISVRGLHALDRLGLKDEVLKYAIPMRGRMIHGVDGELKYQAYGTGDNDAINSLSRGWLNGFLLDQAEKTGKIRVHFEKELSAIDMAARKLTFADRAEADYHTVIGTDGSASVIRAEMERLAYTKVSSEELSHSYKEFVMHAELDGRHKMEKHALHIWPRGQFMMIALPNFDGSFTCTLFLPNEGELSFQSLTDAEKVAHLFHTQFPDFVKMVPDFAEQFFEHPTGRMFTVKTSHWAPDKFDREVLLLGDAAHAIVPFFGQGMNCGFEDCEILLPGWERCLKEGFSHYSAARRVDTDAIADMAVENFTEMSAKTADPAFLLEKQIEHLLQGKFPDYVSRYTMVSFSRVPYSLARKVGEVQKSILAELCAGKKRVEEVSLAKAGPLIEERLSRIMRDEVRWTEAQWKS